MKRKEPFGKKRPFEKSNFAGARRAETTIIQEWIRDFISSFGARPSHPYKLLCYEDMKWAVQANDIEAMRLLIRTHFNTEDWENRPLEKVPFTYYAIGLDAVRANDATEEMRRAIYEEYSRTRKLATRSLHCVLSDCWK